MLNIVGPTRDSHDDQLSKDPSMNIENFSVVNIRIDSPPWSLLLQIDSIQIVLTSVISQQSRK